MQAIADPVAMLAPVDMDPAEALVADVEATLDTWRRVHGVMLRLGDVARHDHVPECVLADLSRVAGPTYGHIPEDADAVLHHLAAGLDRCVEVARRCRDLGPAGTMVWRALAEGLADGREAALAVGRVQALAAARVALGGR